MDPDAWDFTVHAAVYLRDRAGWEADRRDARRRWKRLTALLFVAITATGTTMGVASALWYAGRARWWVLGALAAAFCMGVRYVARLIEARDGLEAWQKILDHRLALKTDHGPLV